MSVFEMLNRIMIEPVSLLLETVYGMAYEIMASEGGAIIPLSLAVNFLLLPFYRRAEEIQKKERELERRMADGLAHIKRTFNGDERYMIQQAYYRINHYKPIFALRSALPLLLQIPFFIAAYQFLSNLGALKGVSFGILSDLGEPDGLLQIGAYSVNLLPILMTLINIISAGIYTRSLKAKDKLQLYGMAGIFLVLLYDSPSGLTFYWTLNNVFSLVKNMVGASRKPKRAGVIACSALGAVALAYGALDQSLLPFRRLDVFLFAFVFQIPFVLYLVKTRKPRHKEGAEPELKEDRRVFLLGGIFLAALTGILIPSAVIRSSPAEFVLTSDYQNPLVYVLSSALTACGAFIVWPGLFYYLAGRKARLFLEAAVWIACGAGVMNYMLFGTELGMLTAQLQFEQTPVFSNRELIINAEVILFAAAALLVLWMKRRRAARAVLPVMILALACMSVYNMAEINAQMPEIKKAVDSGDSEMTPVKLSRNGENVIVIMMDKAVGCFIPYLMQEKPELEDMFDGFTWYPNTLSYGPATNTGSPGIYGGYEYTPEEMNRRDQELLADKHNEALKLMPVLFDEEGYRVTVCDPPYAGYGWIPDLSIYDDYPNITAYRADSGEAGNQYTVSNDALKNIWERNFFCYGLMKTVPLFFQTIMYQEGAYFEPGHYGGYLYQIQISDGISRAKGMRRNFSQAYNALCALPDMTQISDDEQNTFFVMCNDTTHDTMLLQEPDYEPAYAVDNTGYDLSHIDRFVYDGREMDVDSAYKMAAYQCNMAALLKLGEWFDYMRSEGVYDNTRIIIVSDHGFDLSLFDDAFTSDDRNIVQYNALLMVKDFNSSGFSVDDQFMTNADTPTVAMDGLIDDPINPFTGKTVNNDAKYAGEQHIFYTDISQTDENNGTKFLPGTWYAFSGQDIFDAGNWRKLGDY